MYKFNGTSEGFAEITLNPSSDIHVVKSVKCLDGYGREQVAHYTNKDQSIPRKQITIDMNKLNEAREWANNLFTTK